MAEVTKIIVSGFGCSGSSAVVDWAREFDGCYVFDGEFDFFRNPDGVMDLREALTSRITLRRCYLAMERFDRFISVMARRPKNQFGRNLESLAFAGFEAHMREFLRALVGVSYPAGDVAAWIQKHTEITHYGNLIDEGSVWSGTRKRIQKLRKYSTNRTGSKAAMARALLRLLGHPASTTFDRMYLPRALTKPEFDIIARPYFDRMAELIGPPEKTHLLLDQAIAPVDMPSGLDLMSNCRAVVVFRDPRDVFMSGLKNRSWIPTDTAEDFAKWMSIAMPVNQINDPRVVLIDFKDLFVDPDRSFDYLAKFMGLDATKRAEKGSHFDSDASSRNIGRWKEHPDQHLIAEVSRLCQPMYDAMRFNATNIQ